MTGLLAALVTSLFFPGIILRVKSIASGRKGPGILQPWKNILLLLRKGSVFSTVTGFVFRLAPAVGLATVLCAILLVPFPGNPAAFSFAGDFIFLATLLALGKFFLISSSLDTGSSFEGMGASREALYSLLTEPAFIILFATLALLTGENSMQEIFASLSFSGHLSFIIGFIAIYLLVQIAMIENSRMPVDDPKTHLELTMIHEVMILDHSGFDLALLHLANTFKFALYGLLIANFLVPADAAVAWRIAAFLGIQVTFAGMIGLMESFRARKKLARNPQFIVTLSSIALVAFLLVMLIRFKMAV